MPISVVSPTGRAVQELLQRTPPNQHQDVLNQHMGLVPLSELFTMQRQIQQLQAAKPPQPTPPTVADSMRQELAGRSQGIADLPVQNVGNEKAYARGGIVAFEGGGPAFGTPYRDEILRAQHEADIARIRAGMGIGGGPSAAAEAPYIEMPSADPLAGQESRFARSSGPRAAVAEDVIGGAAEAKPSLFSRAKEFATKPRTIGGIGSFSDLGSATANLGRYVVQHPVATVGKVVKFGAEGAAIPVGINAIGDATSLYGMDPRYLREAYGEDKSTAYGNKNTFGDIVRRGGAVAEDILPDFVYEGIHGHENTLKRAQKLQAEDVVKGRWTAEEKQWADRYQAAVSGRSGEDPEAVAEAYRNRHNKNPQTLDDLAKYFNGADYESGGGGRQSGSMGGIGSLDVDRAFAPTQALLNSQMQGASVGNESDDIAAKMAQYKSMGIGQGAEDYQKYLDSQQKDLPDQARQNKWLAASKGFFDMAKAASQPGATFLGAAASGADTGLSEYNRLQDKLDATKDKLAAAEFAVAQSREGVAKGAIDSGSAEHQRKEDRYQSLQDKVIALEAQKAGKKVDAELDMMKMNVMRDVASIQSAGRTKEAAMFQRAYINAFKAGDVEGARRIAKAANELAMSISPPVLAAQVRAQAANQFMPIPAGMQGAPATDGGGLAGWGDVSVQQ